MCWESIINKSFNSEVLYLYVLDEFKNSDIDFLGHMLAYLARKCIFKHIFVLIPFLYFLGIILVFSAYFLI